MSVFSKKTSTLCCILFSILSSQAVQAAKPSSPQNDPFNQGRQQLQTSPNRFGINMTFRVGRLPNGEGKGKVTWLPDGTMYAYIKDENNHIVASRRIGNVNHMTDEEAMQTSLDFFSRHMSGIKKPENVKIRLSTLRPGNFLHYLNAKQAPYSPLPRLQPPKNNNNK